MATLPARMESRPSAPLAKMPPPFPAVLAWTRLLWRRERPPIQTPPPSSVALLPRRVLSRRRERWETQWTRYLTILVCLIQGVMVAVAMIDPSRIGLQNPGAPLFVGNSTVFVLVNTVVLTCTTMVFMWLGEQITERGIGNGVSLIITIGIVSRLPHAIIELAQMAAAGKTPGGSTFGPVQFLLLMVVFCAVTAATILLSQGYRRIPIQMIRKTVGKTMNTGSTYMPLKVNFANVMPIIFAGAIMMVPEFIFQTMAARHGGFWITLTTMFRQDGLGYMIVYGALILIFSFFWVANQFNPLQIADNLKKESSYIPGISPGQPTADFLDAAMTRVTAGGRGLSAGPRPLPHVPVPQVRHSFHGRPVLRRHQSAHHGRSRSRYHEPAGVPSDHAPLRRIFEKRTSQEPQWTLKNHRHCLRVRQGRRQAVGSGLFL